MGPVVATLNFLNNLVHFEPICIVVDFVFWVVVFLVGFPIAAVISLIRGVYQFLGYFLGPSDLNPNINKNREECSIVITGCDSGFGRELVEPLTARGYTVFAGCLKKESFTHFKNDALAIPLQFDVTSDKSVADALKTVSAWLEGGGTKKRYLHAIVNNAGVGIPTMIDWAALSDFKTCIDINYLGMVRSTKAFIPIFQKQAIQGTYSDARIVNMVSMAGLFQGGDGSTAYVASKHAADAFSNNLRLEMGAFGVHVTTINPTFHQTPMANPNLIESRVNSVWRNLDEELREEYGEGTIYAAIADDDRCDGDRFFVL